MPASLSRAPVLNLIQDDPETRHSLKNYTLAFRMTQVISDRDAGHEPGMSVAAVNLMIIPECRVFLKLTIVMLTARTCNLLLLLMLLPASYFSFSQIDDFPIDSWKAKL